MSELRLNVLDAERAICGEIHGSVADAAVAGLSADPETIEELQGAIARFIKPVNGCEPFAGFTAGTSDEPWDAGIMFIDLAACIVACESSYSVPEAEGEVPYHDGERATDVWLSYRVSDDWLFVDSVAEYKAVCEKRRAERCETRRLDTRGVLYGAVVEFIVTQCLAARESGAEDPIAGIHARWLMTPRPDLRDRSPRDLMLERLDFIESDLQSRELQWSCLDQPAPCLPPNSAAYRYAGFGRHEIVVYYELLRFLISDCWKRVSESKDVSVADEVALLSQLKADWLESPQPDYEGKNPGSVIDCERKRLPLIVPAEDLMTDDDCPVCRWMAEEYRPTFWHLDGCNMDDDFPFSFDRTRAEWDEERSSRKQFAEEFNRKWEQQKSGVFEDGRPSGDEDAEIH